MSPPDSSSVLAVHDAQPERDAVRDCWIGALGHKSRCDDGHLLHLSVGMKRILRLQELLKERIGAALPLSVLLHLGTPEAIAAAIRAGRWPPHCPCVLMRDGANEHQLFIVPAGGGVILELCELALSVPFQGRIWGLQAPGVDGEIEPLTCIEALASRYVDTVMHYRGPAAPASTVSLVGYSFSGLVIVEMARQLRSMGVQLKLVAMLDTTCHPRYWPRSEALRFALKRARLRWTRLATLPPAAAWAFTGESLRALVGLLARLQVKNAAKSPVDASAYYIGGLPPALQKLRDACLVAYEAYRPSPVGFPVVLFKSQQGDPHACDPEGLWKRLAPLLVVRVVPGTHTTMVRQPHVRQLAAELGKHL